ncbi:MAG: hypothetical protein LAQ30_21935, partial [Acidobacteriia bacterium]|nr:hypothetical protein [Terriglobia bacterium]
MSWFKPAGNSAGGAPEPEEVRAQLAAILASHCFPKAGVQQKDLLRYLVERALEGDSAALQERAIAAAVFGRKESFDPEMDGVVRLVAERLRKSLDRYYAGRRRRRTPIRIDLPRGSYSPLFTRRTRGAAVRRTALLLGAAAVLALAVLGASRLLHPKPEARRYRSVAVLPFENVNRLPEVEPYVAGVVANLTEKLTMYQSLRVVGQVSPEFRGQVANATAVARRLAVDALLEGGVYLHDGQVKIGLALVDGRDGRTLWT